MPELPSGTVTFLFSDIEGSTNLLRELGDSYAEALAEHRGVIRAAFEERAGVEVDTQGDAFFAAFARAPDAVAAATEIQGNMALDDGDVGGARSYAEGSAAIRRGVEGRRASVPRRGGGSGLSGLARRKAE